MVTELDTSAGVETDLAPPSSILTLLVEAVPQKWTASVDSVCLALRHIHTPTEMRGLDASIGAPPPPGGMAEAVTHRLSEWGEQIDRGLGLDDLIHFGSQWWSRLDQRPMRKRMKGVEETRGCL